MFTPDEKIIFDKIMQQLDSILENNTVKSLQRKDVLGSQLSFAPGQVYFERTFKMLNKIKQANLSDLALPQLQLIENIVSQFSSVIDQIKSFSVDVSNPVQTRDNLIDNLVTIYNTHSVQIIQLLSFSLMSAEYQDTMKNEFNEILNHIKQVSQTRLEELEQKLNESVMVENKIKSILDSAMISSGQVGVVKYANFFEDESKEHSKVSSRWLIATILVGIGTASWGYFNFNGTEMGLSVGDAISVLGSKVIVLSVMYYLLVWCSKNYNASRHNYIINRHKKNALHTFESFVKSADDGETKNAVLLQATQSIFSNQPSGYINKETEQDSPNKVIEIMRSITPLTKTN